MSKTTLVLDRVPADSGLGNSADGARDTGTITIVTVPPDGDTITIGDGLAATPAVFTFDTAFDEGTLPVRYLTTATVTEVATALARAINRASNRVCAWTATSSGAVVTLTHVRTGDTGVTWTVSAPEVTTVAPAGGSGIMGGVGAQLEPQAIRDQTGYLLFSVDNFLITAGGFEVQGRADATGNFVTLLVLDVASGTNWQDGVIPDLSAGGGGVSVAFPLMPQMRVNVSDDLAGTGVEDFHVSVWILE